MFMERRHSALALLLCLCTSAPSRADDIQARLKKAVEADKRIVTTFKEALDYLGKNFDLKFEIDLKAFAANDLPNPEKKEIRLIMTRGESVDALVRWTLKEVSAMYDIRDDTIVVVPWWNQGKRRFMPPLLTQAAGFDEPMGDSLRNVLNEMSFSWALRIVVDTEAFKAEGLPDPLALKVWVPRTSSASMDSTLRLTLPQVQAVYEIRGDALFVVPNRLANKPRHLPAYSAEQIKAMEALGDLVSKKEIEIDKDFEAPVTDVIGFICDRCDLTIIVDPSELAIPIEEKARAKQGKYKFNEFMALILKGIKATYRIEPDHIRIVRQRES
jgi:hypothetical protein